METKAETRGEGRSEDPPNNPLKMVTLVPVFVLGVILIAFGATGAGSWALVTRVIVVVATAPSIYVTARGRNPRWNRAPFDRPGDPSKAAGRRRLACPSKPGVAALAEQSWRGRAVSVPS